MQTQSDRLILNLLTILKRKKPNKTPAGSYLLALVFLGIAPVLMAQVQPPQVRSSLSVPRLGSNQPDLGAVYLENAQKQFALGNSQEALALTRRGLQVSPQSSDLLFALQGFAQGRPPYDVESALEASLEYGNFRVFKAQDAAVAWYGLLLRRGQFAKADQDLTTRWNVSELLAEPGLLAMAVRIHRVNDRFAQAQALLDRGLRTHPLSPLLWTVVLEGSDAPYLNASLALRRMTPNLPGYWDFAQALASRLPLGEERRSLLQALVGQNKASPWHLWLLTEDELAVENPSPGTEYRAMERFIKGGGLGDAWAVLKMAEKIQDTQARTLLDASLGGPESVVAMDRDTDGYAEERFYFVSGSLLRWTRDNDQDGLVDMDAPFSNGEPRALVVHDFAHGRHWMNDYTQGYPYTSKTWFSNQGTLWAFSHDTRTFEDRFVDIPAEALTPLLALGLKFYPRPSFDLELLAEQSWWLDAYQDDPNRELNPGMLPFLEGNLVPEPLDGPDHGLLAVVLPGQKSGPMADLSVFDTKNRAPRGRFALEGGMAIAGERDSVGTGTYDVRYVFEEGKTSLAFRDMDGRGTFEVVEAYDLQGLREVRYGRDAWTYRVNPRTGLHEWDVNADGRVDIRELRNQWDRVWMEFSRRGDGTFDVRRP